MTISCDDLFRALADPTRRAVFERLMQDEAAVVDLTLDSGSRSPPSRSTSLCSIRRYEPEVGHKFTFRVTPFLGGGTGASSARYSPSSRCGTRGGGGSDPSGASGRRLDTVVTWTLEPTVAGGTILHLSHVGFTEKTDLPSRT